MRTQDDPRYATLIRDMRSRGDAIESLQAEFEQAKFDTLMRIGRTVEQHIANVHRLQAQLAAASPTRRTALRERLRRAHREATRYRGYLDVQREVMRLRRLRPDDPRYLVPPLRR